MKAWKEGVVPLTQWRGHKGQTSNEEEHIVTRLCYKFLFWSFILNGPL